MSQRRIRPPSLAEAAELVHEMPECRLLPGYEVWTSIGDRRAMITWANPEGDRRFRVVINPRHTTVKYITPKAVLPVLAAIHVIELVREGLDWVLGKPLCEGHPARSLPK